jgi:hypothetical protein
MVRQDPWLRCSANTRGSRAVLYDDNAGCGDERGRVRVHACRAVESDQTHFAEIDGAELWTRIRDDVGARRARRFAVGFGHHSTTPIDTGQLSGYCRRERLTRTRAAGGNRYKARVARCRQTDYLFDARQPAM